MYKNLFEKLRLVEFDYEALYVEVVRIKPEGFREIADMLQTQLGWDMEMIKTELARVYELGAYIEKNTDDVKELRDLPGKIVIPMITFNDDAGELTVEKVVARFNPDDEHESLFISDEWS